MASLLALSQGDEGGRAAAACMSVRLRGRDTDEVVAAEHVDGVAEKAVLAGGDVSEVRMTYRNRMGCISVTIGGGGEVGVKTELGRIVLLGSGAG